jgi:hypothetical protein
MQGINVFASTAARDAAITSPQEGQFAYTKDTNSLWYYTGSAWAASGATGDIEGVTAGVGITGGGTSGTVTITNDMATTITAAGDIVVGTGSGTYDNLPIGTTAQVLTADTTVSPYKVKWASPTSGGMTLLSTTTLTGTTVTISSISQSYTDLLLEFRQVHASNSTFGYRTNGITTSNYYFYTEKIGNGIPFATAWTGGGTSLLFADTVATDTNNPAYLHIYDYANTTASFKLCESVIYSDGNDEIQKIVGVNRGTGTSGIDSITIFCPAANNISGTVLLYGVK